MELQTPLCEHKTNWNTCTICRPALNKHTPDIEGKLKKLENVIISRTDPLFVDGTKLLLEDYKATLQSQADQYEREKGGDGEGVLH